MGVHNETMDRLLDELNVLPSTEMEKAREIVWQIQEVWAENVPLMPTFLPDACQYIRKEWTGYVPTPGGMYTVYNPWTMINISCPTKTHFKMCVGAVQDNVNPLRCINHRDLFVRMLLYDTLLKFSPDYLEMVPYLAESWEASEDGRSYTFHIRENAKWHDGQPLTSEDVAFTFNYLIDKKVPGYYENLKYIGTIETLDEHTVTIKLDQDFFWFMPTLQGVPIIPKHIWQDKEWNWLCDPPIGCGPFKWGEYIEGEYLELPKNEEWWMEGYPKIDTWSWRVIPDAEARVLSVRKGETDADRYEPFTAGLIPTVLEAEELVVVTRPTIFAQQLVLNCRRPPLDDVRVRRAIAYALNHDDYLEKAYLGYGTPMYSIMPNALFPYWYNPKVVEIFPTKPDIEMANRILDEAGYIDVDNDGIREMPGAVAPTPVWTYYAVGGIIAVVVIVGAVVIYLRRK
jgi:peptide/nickel transport system substrate-binding protein